jgi:hypothetical protein
MEYSVKGMLKYLCHHIFNKSMLEDFGWSSVMHVVM